MSATSPLISKNNNNVRGFSYVLVFTVFLLLFVSVLFVVENSSSSNSNLATTLKKEEGKNMATSEVGVVAADHVRCSEIGLEALKAGGHAVDAAVATMLCLGVVHQVSSGIGGGTFMVVRSAETGEAFAFDARETAPGAATKNMFENNPESKTYGALAMCIPGELAGLHAAWTKYGKLPWKNLVQPAIKLARDGFTVVPYLAEHIQKEKKYILADPGLRAVYAPGGRGLRVGDTCYNPVLAQTLEQISVEGPKALYNGSVGEKFVEDMRNAGGIITMEDMRNYKVKVTRAVEIDALGGYKMFGMPPPSIGTVGISLVFNILRSYKSLDAVRGLLGFHRMIEAFKHMFAILVNLGDPDFANIDNYVSDLLSTSYASTLQKKIFDNTTFDSSYYLARWSQIEDHGTSHLCIVDANRNAVSMTSTVNYYFGAAMLSPSTGIVPNNQMYDFAVPGEPTPGQLPPSPANFIEPNKRPVSSMTPIIIVKDNQLAGAIGASGGTKIMGAVVEVFLNHFIFGMKPLASVKKPRAYHQLVPNIVEYDNFTTYEEEHIVFPADAMLFLEKRGHVFKQIVANPGAVIQLVVHSLKEQAKNSRKIKMVDSIFRGMLTAVCDPRKDGTPAGL